MNFRYLKTISLLLALVFLCSCGGNRNKADKTNVSQTGAISREKRERLVRKSLSLIQDLSNENFVRARKDFDLTMQFSLPEKALRKHWKRIKGKIGRFEKHGNVKLKTNRDFVIVFVHCLFTKGQIFAKVVFNADEKVTGLWFLPPDSPEVKASNFKNPPYAHLESFYDRKVTVGKDTPWELPGVLSIPQGKGPFPAVVLIHGSGPGDRDATVGFVKPFRDIAWGLASRGIIVLRYDKRTRVHQDKLTAILEQFTVEDETINDAVQAVKLLKKTEEVDKDRIFILGHSLGGTLIPRIAKKTPDVRGFIFLAAAARPLEDYYLEQFAYVFNLDKNISKKERKQFLEVKEGVAKIKSPNLSKLPKNEIILGGPPAYWIDLKKYDQLKEAKKMKRPLLVLQGGRDYQVPEKDFELWKKAFSDNKKAKFKKFENMNHLFVEGKGPSKPAEYKRPSNVSEKVIEHIKRWVLRQ